MEAYRVWAEIDLDSLSQNLAAIRRHTGPGVALMLVVKADAYGHGAVAIAHHALRSGVAALGVGTSKEALELRQAGVRARILVLGTIVDDEAPAALRHGVEIALHSADRCRKLQALARRMDLRARVHLKVDTGMGRLGVLPDRALALLEQIRTASHLELCGVMTHAASPQGAHDPQTGKQMAIFDELVAKARAANLARGWIHAANSACIFTGLGRLHGAVRPGIGAYGVLPGDLEGADELAPVMSLHSQIVFLKDLPAGSAVGYAGTWRAERATRIAIVPVGYSDGIEWRLSNRGHALVRGMRAPFVGRVSMDYTTLDVSDIRGVAVGDRVTLIGSQGRETIRLEDVARAAETIAYEICCSVGRRVERIYVGGEELLLPQQPPRFECAPAVHAPEPLASESAH